MAAPMRASRIRGNYLIQFAHQHTDFRIAELKALIDLFNVDIQWDEKSLGDESPYLKVKILSEEDVRKIGSRSVLIKNIIELWGHGGTYSELNESLRETNRNIMVPHFVKEKSFKFELDAFNKKLSHSYKLEMFQHLPQDVLAFQGDVSLDNPDEAFFLLEDYGPFGSQAPENPHQIYFGRQISEGQRDAIRKYTLQSRKFIANTSMDACLSLLMANIGQVKKDNLVIDPFVGTGSLLVACAHHGAYVMGTDINYLLLHARGKPSRAKQEKRESDESIQANLCQYGLGDFYLDAVIGDASKHRMWRQQPMFDAIITDPPYGVREKAKKVGTGVEDVKLSDDQKIGHVPHKVDYHLGQIFKDLLNFAAKFLHMGGRLVYWFPVYRRSYKEENIPTHPCLHRIANCEQALNCRISRRLITMEKVRPFEEIHESDNAQVEVDHYEDASFRQMYFHPRQSKGDNSKEQVENGELSIKGENDNIESTSLTENG
ncbi:tRNA (guanine(10)-N2)-methyltransferase homolog [Mizuhopecten yessoensis]|uniref:tRNA (guanine(10)-N(2))-methyltransferase TRMT11 n=1 Tax=Mizuhopecten yessoensis TaxID=6573 RepID=A0A210QXH0_MIZYE|nr:tRNA (guanine(10)-N2)-methyltransferase homolog [Mizuhopecten yessoensis]OWF53424.1 tRNA (guanine(10)-N2)-methyltransferase-like [Mizuhopecten yessoensis]